MSVLIRLKWNTWNADAIPTASSASAMGIPNATRYQYHFTRHFHHLRTSSLTAISPSVTAVMKTAEREGARAPTSGAQKCNGLTRSRASEVQNQAKARTK